MSFLVLAFAACWWEPCPTEGMITVSVFDSNGAPVCPDTLTAEDEDGTILAGTCSYGCHSCEIETLIEGDHVVTATLGEEEVVGEVYLTVWERCVEPEEDIELQFE